MAAIVIDADTKMVNPLVGGWEEIELQLNHRPQVYRKRVTPAGYQYTWRQRTIQFDQARVAELAAKRPSVAQQRQPMVVIHIFRPIKMSMSRSAPRHPRHH